jgi:hypothetical protein
MRKLKMSRYRYHIDRKITNSYLGHIKLILWFSGHFFQYLMREGGAFFSVFKMYRNDAGGIFLIEITKI